MLPLGDFLEESSAAFPLTGEGLRNWLGTAGSFLFREETSGADLLQFLRDNGVSIRTQDFYDIRRQVLSETEQVVAKEVSLTVYGDNNPDSLIPQAYSVEKPFYQMADNYLYRYRIESVNPVTGEVQYQYMAVSSRYQLTFNEAADLMNSLYTGQYVSDGFTVTDRAIEAAFVREGL